VAIGNGRNDRLMLAAAVLGIGVVGGEGLAGEALRASGIVVRHIVDALRIAAAQAWALSASQCRQ
jgi:soluble P-type ATPase